MGAALSFTLDDGERETAVPVTEPGHEGGHLDDDIMVGERRDPRLEVGGRSLERLLGDFGKREPVGGFDFFDQELKVLTPFFGREDAGRLLRLGQGPGPDWGWIRDSGEPKDESHHRQHRRAGIGF